MKKCHNEMVPGRLVVQGAHEMEEVEAKVERRGRGAGRERAAAKGNARLSDHRRSCLVSCLRREQGTVKKP